MSLETLNLLRGIAPLLAMGAFVAVVLWSWSRRRRESFDEAARLPLEEDPDILRAERQSPARR